MPTAQRRFDLPLRAGCFADTRPQPDIPSRAVGLSLVLGEGVHIPSFLQLQEETKLPQWQRWVGYPHPISHDTFGYVSARLDPGQLRRAGIWINRKLKRGKAFEANKIAGLLVVSLDANEQFCSDHRCCEDCLTRELTCKDAEGQEFKTITADTTVTPKRVWICQAAGLLLAGAPEGIALARNRRPRQSRRRTVARPKNQTPAPTRDSAQILQGADQAFVAPGAGVLGHCQHHIFERLGSARPPKSGAILRTVELLGP